MPASPFQLYRQAYHGLSRNSWLLSLVMLINRSGTMVVPFIALYCTQKLHFTVEQAGYIMGIFGLGSILGAYLGGKLTDRYGFYDIQLFALLSGGIMFILLGLQRSFWPLAILSFVLSLCNDAFRPANSAAIAHHSSPETKTRSYSLNRLAVNLGWAFGGAIGGILASINYSWLFWVDGCTNIFAALVLLKLIPRSDYRNTHVKAPPTEIVNSAYKDKAYLVFIILATMFATCFFQMFGLQSVFYKTKWHYNEDYIGILMAINGLLIAVIEMVVVHRLEGRRHPLIYIAIGVLLTGISFSVMSILPASPFSGLTVVAFITLGEMISMPFMNAFWVARTNNYNRGQYAALYSMSWAAAQLLAPTLGTQVVEKAGFNMLWWATGAVCAVAAFGFWLLYNLKFRSKN